MTVCANCGSPQGPFVRDSDYPNKPVCGYTRRHRFDNVKARNDAFSKRIQECNARRDARYA